MKRRSTGGGGGAGAADSNNFGRSTSNGMGDEGDVDMVYEFGKSESDDDDDDNENEGDTEDGEYYSDSDDGEEEEDNEEEEEEEQLISPEEWKAQGNEAYKQGKYLQAIDFYTKAVDADAKQVSIAVAAAAASGTGSSRTAACVNPAFLTNRAAAFMMLKRYKDCIADCEAALSSDPRNTKALQRMATAQQRQGKMGASIKTLNRLCMMEPRNETFRKLRDEAERLRKGIEGARAYLERNIPSRALRVVDSLMQRGTRENALCLSLRTIKAEALLALGRGKEAEEEATALLRADSTRPDFLCIRARALAVEGNIASAVKHLQQALRRDPDNAACKTLFKHLRKLQRSKEEGNAKVAARQWAEARDAYTRGLELDTRRSYRSFCSRVLCNRALCHAKMAKYPAAITDCDEAIKLDDSYVKAYMRRASALRSIASDNTRQQQECVDCLQRSCHDLHKVQCTCIYIYTYIYL